VLHTLGSPGAARSDSTDPREEALRSLRGLYASMRHRSGQVRRATGLGSAFVWALADIAAHPGTRIGDLAERLCIHASTASNLCARLGREGLVISRPAKMDRRAMCLFIAARGKALLGKVPPARRASLARALGRLTAEECRALSRALEPLTRAVCRM
jgi:DNA-binding MarR family transcriptional regulator